MLNEIIQLLTANNKIIILVLITLGMDVITGVLKAIVNKELDSSKFRTGLLHQFANLLLLVFAIIVDVGFSLNGSVGVVTATFIIGMSGISVLENLAASGIAVPKVLTDTLAKINGKE